MNPCGGGSSGREPWIGDVRWMVVGVPRALGNQCRSQRSVGRGRLCAQATQ